jgi:restriction system protein
MGGMAEEQRLPKYHETFIPILTVLNRDGELSRRELLTKVRDEYYSDLPEEELARQTKPGESLILNRIGWGIVYLKQAKLIEQPERAMFKITQKGKRVLENGELSLKDLKSDPDYQAYEAQKKQRNTDDRDFDDNASPQDMIDKGVREIEYQVKSDLLDRLQRVDPYYFEEVISGLLSAMGYGKPAGTTKSGDGGIDGIINQDPLGVEKIYIQAKRFNENQVREKDIRDFIGAMAGGTSKGVFVTTSTFHESAIQRAREVPNTIILIDGDQLVDLMVRHNVGVQVKNTYEVKEVDEDFFEE